MKGEMKAPLLAPLNQRYRDILETHLSRRVDGRVVDTMLHKLILQWSPAKTLP